MGAAAVAPADEDLLADLARSARPRFEQREQPFTHWVAHDVFPPDVYEQLAAAFREVHARGLSEPPDPKRLSRRMKGYDAYSLTLTRIGGPLEALQTRPWHDLLQRLTGAPSTLDVSAALHHHKVGSAHGKVHNDYNPAFFVDSPKADGVNVNDPRLCHYQKGEVYRPGLVARATVRAVAALFYLANGPWSGGDGGETGLYRGSREPVDQPVAKVPPIDNSMLVFECTPASYHSFLSNVRRERNSVILWLHRSRADAAARYGEERLVTWK